MRLITILALALAACHTQCPPGPPSDGGPPPPPPPTPEAGQDEGGAPSDAAPPPVSGPSTGPLDATPVVAVANHSGAQATVYIAFGSDSVVKGWPFCQTDAGFVGCVLTLPTGGTMSLPRGNKYLNATISFNGNGCGTTKAELNLGNPAWNMDTVDVSLVDGYSNKVEIEIPHAGADASMLVLGPPAGKTGNEKIMGVFPAGCDICVARQSPPCRIVPCGSSPNDGGQNCGCKSGGQYAPTVPCQWSGPRGLSYFVTLR